MIVRLMISQMISRYMHWRIVVLDLGICRSRYLYDSRGPTVTPDDSTSEPNDRGASGRWPCWPLAECVLDRKRVYNKDILCAYLCVRGPAVQRYREEATRPTRLQRGKASLQSYD